MDIRLEDVLVYEQPTKYIVSSENYSDAFSTPVLTAGKTFVLGYTDETSGICNASDSPVIIFDDFTSDCKYVDFDFKVKSSAMKILHKLNTSDNLRYYFYAMQAIDYTPFSHKRVWISEFSKFKIKSRSVEEQNRIVEDLDNVTSAIENANQRLNALDELVKSRFIEMFGDFETNSMNWEIKPFSYFASIDGNMTSDFEKYADYPHIGVGNIEKDTGNLIDYKTIKEDNVISGKYLFTPEHIIYSKIRPNLNKVALPTFDGLCSADAYPILPNKENCNRIFLAIAMRSEYFLGYILQFSSRANMPKVNRKEISGFTMPLPPLSLQNEFAGFVKLIDKSKFIVQKQIEDLQELLDKKMDEYFG